MPVWPLVCAQNWKPGRCRNQSTTVHPIRWFYSLQPKSDLRHLHLDHRWLLRSVLSPKLQTPGFQWILILDYGSLWWRQSDGSLRPLVCCVRRWWSFAPVPLVVGKQREWKLWLVSCDRVGEVIWMIINLNVARKLDPGVWMALLRIEGYITTWLIRTCPGEAEQWRNNLRSPGSTWICTTPIIHRTSYIVHNKFIFKTFSARLFLALHFYRYSVTHLSLTWHPIYYQHGSLRAL